MLLAGHRSPGPAAPAAGTTAGTPAATSPATSSRAPASRPHKSSAARRAPAKKATAAALPPAAKAAAALVGDLQAGVADGQVTQQAGQDLFSHLQPLLFGPPGQNAQQIQDQFTQLVKAYDQHQSQGQITGKAAATVPNAITALGAG